jgi:hypothetical protein
MPGASETAPVAKRRQSSAPANEHSVIALNVSRRSGPEGASIGSAFGSTGELLVERNHNPD